MAKNHYTRGTTQLSKDVFIVSGLVVRRIYPRREGVVGGAAQAYVENGKDKVIGYTLEDVRKVAEARKKEAKAKPEPNLAKALNTIEKLPGKPKINPKYLSIAEINKLIAEKQKEVKPCPCCCADAQLRTYDCMTFGIECKALDCRMKIERGVVNERGPAQCIDIILAAWNRRAAFTTPTKTAKLLALAESAADWLCDTQEGSDQHERGVELRKAINAFGR